MRVEEAVGQRIAVLRERAGMSQGVFGAHVSELLAGEWPRQNVYAMEKGKRKLGVSDLFAMSVVLGVHVSQLLVMPNDTEELEFPGGVTIPTAQLQGPQSTHPAAGNEVAQVMVDLPMMVREFEKRIAVDHAMKETLEKVYGRLMVALARDVTAEEAG